MVTERYKSLEEFKNSLDQIGLKALDKVYLTYKEEFLLFSKRYDISQEDAHDVYQDTIMAFYENVRTGRLNKLTSSIKTYLFSIGKYSIYNRLKKNSKTITLDKAHLENLDLEAIDSNIQPNEKLVQMERAMDQLGDRCKKILILFYYHSYSIEALMHELDYKNENVVRSHKSRCLRSLKELIKGYENGG
ncbi:RNA polymerase sigma factor [Portibacter marinus]|uniref:RNA polymerase sigma factor n=1 Tax=Portibacter marinus TaxID=2898660 RepID=UPI001F1EB5CF|nr:sigma-70 family RNA polymerase sigma factor [Portibacter marinus]